MSDWQPIETAPNDGRAFLAADKWGNQWICTIWQGRLMGLGEGVLAVAKNVAEDAKYWMPLPKPPPSELIG